MLVFSTLVPEPPRALTVTPGPETVGVMSPGADGLQLVMLSDHAPESISSWSTVNCTESVASIGVQQPVTNSTKLSSLTSAQLLTWI